MSVPDEGTARRCPICGRPEDAELRPFCSKRCADVDLGRWLKGTYVVPGREADEGDQPTSGIEENKD
ncbi:MAG TPA: DNA gyrase inhibitor YacG [Rhizomicrobium sp.]|jgi:hypothetical protein|nr:DNA gyrase inhibitor YacG [Rhizomicrobium sp.]